MLTALRTFVVRRQHTLSIGAFCIGFFIDTLVLKRIDLWISNAVLLSYLVLVIVSMLALHRAAARSPRGARLRTVMDWVPFIAQFAFGGMFSGFLIFYSQSGSLFASWPFLFIIVALIITNEFLRSYQSRLTFQATLLFFCLFSFAIYAVPILVQRIGTGLFFMSACIAVVLLTVFLSALALIDRKRVDEARRGIALRVTGVLVLVSTLYLLNILPPIPLALKSAGVYQSVERVDGAYQALVEPYTWGELFWQRTLTVSSGSSIFFYSAVFAPTNLITTVVHHWQYREDGGWHSSARIPFSIQGGRDGGYRGFSEITAREGEWRVRVETERGQMIGLKQFTVRFGLPPLLEPRILD